MNFIDSSQFTFSYLGFIDSSHFTFSYLCWKALVFLLWMYLHIKISSALGLPPFSLVLQFTSSSEILPSVAFIHAVYRSSFDLLFTVKHAKLS